MRNTAQAFRWIVGLLRRRRIPFQIFGGLAARAYGASRRLADIDIAIPDRRFKDLLPYVRPRVTYGPARYRDKNWDWPLMTLRYAGQEIDIGGASVKVYDAHARRWVRDSTNFSRSTYRKLYGLIVPIVPRRSLISYKRRLGRRVDFADVRALSAK